MPASGLDCGWPHKTPIFQVYGTKRKANDERPQETLNQQEYNVVKRHCAWEESRSEDMCMEVNHNSVASYQALPHSAPACPSPPHVQQAAVGERLHQGPCIVSDFPHIHPHSERPSTNTCTVIQSDFPAHPQQQTTHVMDLCDEVYTHTPDLTEECMAMDSDCVPNPNQYGREHREAASLDQQRASFCHDYCGSGTASPTSGRVRCYCKPSWEGMLDMRPYISDVY